MTPNEKLFFLIYAAVGAITAIWLNIRYYFESNRKIYRENIESACLGGFWWPSIIIAYIVMYFEKLAWNCKHKKEF